MGATCPIPEGLSLFLNIEGEELEVSPPSGYDLRRVSINDAHMAAPAVLIREGALPEISRDINGAPSACFPGETRCARQDRVRLPSELPRVCHNSCGVGRASVVVRLRARG